MPPRSRRPHYTQEQIDQQLQQIHLLDPSSSSENLEQLGPIIKLIHSNRHQEAYLRTIQGLIESKDAEIERICSENYQDFIASVSTMFTVKAYTDAMKESIASLDGGVSQLGKGLVEKKRNLLQNKKLAGNLDEAIDTLQACLRILDVVDRVGKMIHEGNYWSALRSLEDIQRLPATSLSQTPFYQHILSSLPSLRAQIKDAVTASMKQWLLEIRNVSAEVGKKDPLLRSSRVGSAVETITYEKTDFDVLNNDKLHVDFKPLFECIHIYTALNSLDELKRSYQADRKAQSNLIIPSPFNLVNLTTLIQEISGFFIVESHVLESAGTFRSPQDVEELWDTLVKGLTAGVERALSTESDPDVFLKTKECLIGFLMTLETSSYSTGSLHSFLSLLLEKYAQLLEAKFSAKFDFTVREDDHLAMLAENTEELEGILGLVWITEAERMELKQMRLPQPLPWSQTFYLCCRDIRGFIQQFYAFVEGVSQHHRNVDDLLCKSLDNFLANHVCETISQRLTQTLTLSQIAQIVTNLEHFQVACPELEHTLNNLRFVQRGGAMKLHAITSLEATLTRALARITSLITSKLDQFFELSEYEWTPPTCESSPSMYLYELVNWLTTVVDSLYIKEIYKDEAYKGALNYIAGCIMNFLIGRDVPMMNENAISNIMIDIDFLEEELKRIGRSHLSSAFIELRMTANIPLSDTVQEYLIPANRHTTYAAVKHKRLQALLEKLAKYGATQKNLSTREIAERRRKEADAVGRLFPGEGR
ncbi:rsec15 [Amanita rubescens]|nr:rsec15 [Amanita rubescens]